MSLLTETTIIESLSGKEERIANFHRPLIKQKFTALNLDEDSGYTRRVLENRGERPMAVPLWFDAVYVKSDVADGDSTIYCDASNRLFHWFRYALLWTDPFNYEPVVITAIDENHVTLHSDMRVSNKHSRGSYLVPLAFGLVKIPDSSYKNAKISTVEIQFTETSGIESWSTATAGKTGFVAVDDFKARSTMRTGAEQESFEDFLIRPEWSSNPAQGAVDDIFFEPLDVGAPHPYMAYELNRRTLKFQFILHRDDLQRFIDYYQHYDGCKGAFWIPTWTHDYSVKENSQDLMEFALSQSEVFRMPERYRSFYGYKDEDQDGTIIRRFIRFNGALNESDVFSGTPTATDEGELPEGGLTAGTWLCGAIKARFRDDDLKITYLGPNVFKLTAEFIEAPDENDSTSKIAYLYCFHHGSDISFWSNYGYAIRTKPYEGDQKTYSTWRAADVVHGEVEHSEQMMGEEIEITISGVLRNWVSSFIDDGKPILVEILKFNIDNYNFEHPNLNIPTSIFKGVVTQSDIGKHGEMNLTLSSKLRVMERDMPCLLLQRQCNAIQWDDRCGLKNKPNWESLKATASITKLGSRKVIYSWLTGGPSVTKDIYNTSTAGTMNWAGSYFLLGEKKYIIIHQGVEDNQNIFELHDDLPANFTTDTITLIPWCDKTIQMCVCRFNNVANFRGFPWLPNNNPVDNLATDDNSVGKK